MDRPMGKLDHSVYTVAWIAPLEIEAQAALHMLDERHDGQFPVSRGDDYIFLAGGMCGHNVVIATLPAGQEYGTGSAAALASQVRKSFPNLWFGLLVGVAAGLPNHSINPPRDIRLGDVLVALPSGDSAGLVAYDLGKAMGESGFQPLRFGHALASTETVVRSAIGNIKLRALSDANLFLPYYEKMKYQPHATGTFIDPGQQNDRLYDINQFGQEEEVLRPERPTSRRTLVWYGPIGSGEKLLRNARQRNELRDRYNVIGLEMEAAGTMNRIPVGVVRGVCDYGDRHKNKHWQPYAAAMAAAYGKAILHQIVPKTAANGPNSARAQPHDDGLNSESDSSAAAPIPNRKRRRKHGFGQPNHDDSRAWLKGHRLHTKGSQTSHDPHSLFERGVAKPMENWPEYQNERPSIVTKYLRRHDVPEDLQANSRTWSMDGRSTPWIAVFYGLSGAGKSQLCLQAIAENEKRFQGIFYMDASNDSSAFSNYLEISRICNIQSHWEGITPAEQIRLTRAWLAGRKEPWLLLIDNADSPDVNLDKYIPTSGCGTILITTTDESFATHSNVFCKVGPMDEDNAFSLLMSYKRPGTVLDSTQVEAARSLVVELLGGLPLAISQAGSYIFNQYSNYVEYCAEFRKFPRLPLSYDSRLRQWSGQRQPIWQTFTLLLNQIQGQNGQDSNRAIELLRTCCFLHHEGIQESLFQEVSADSENTQRRSQIEALLNTDTDSPSSDTFNLRVAFQVLCRYSLVNCTPTASFSRQYSIHSLVQTICRESLTPEEQERYALRAVNMIATALSKIEVPLSWIENPAGFDLQKSLLPHIRACLEGRLEIVCRGRSSEDQTTRTKMLLRLAKAYSATGHFLEARLLLEGTFAAYGTKSLDATALQCMEQLAASNAVLGRYLAALKLRQEIVRAYGAAPADTDALCVAEMNLADSLWVIGRRKEALAIAQGTLKRREAILSPDDRKLLRTIRKVAEYLHGMDQRLLALQLRERVLDNTPLRTNLSEVGLLDNLASKSALADSYQWDGRLIRALELRGEVYSGRTRILGPDHPDTLLACDRMLSAMNSFYPITKTERMGILSQRRQSLNTWERIFGPEHPHTLQARVNLGRSYSSLRRFEEALKEQTLVLETRKLLFAEQETSASMLAYVSSMGDVANVRAKMGQLSVALELRREALRLVETSHTDGEVDYNAIFGLRNHLATCISRQGTSEDIQQGLAMRRAILEEQRNRLQKDDPSILKTMALLASDLQELDAVNEEINVRRELLTKQQRVMGTTNRETLDNMKQVAIALIGSADNLSSQAMQYMRRLEATLLLEKVVEAEGDLIGEFNPATTYTRARLVDAYYKMDQADKARSLLACIRPKYDSLSEDSLSEEVAAIRNMTQSRRMKDSLQIWANATDTLGTSRFPRIQNRQRTRKRKGSRRVTNPYRSSSSEKHFGESGSEASDRG